MYSNLYYTSSYLLTKKKEKLFPISSHVLFYLKKTFFVRLYHFLMCFLSKFGASIWEFIWSNKRLLREELFLNVYKRFAVWIHSTRWIPRKDLCGCGICEVTFISWNIKKDLCERKLLWKKFSVKSFLMCYSWCIIRWTNEKEFPIISSFILNCLDFSFMRMWNRSDPFWHQREIFAFDFFSWNFCI